MSCDQAQFDLRCEWGLAGLRALSGVDAVVIVDVVSFCTAVDIAIARGASVYPYHWKDSSAVQFARQKGALLAVEREGSGISLPEFPFRPLLF